MMEYMGVRRHSTVIFHIHPLSVFFCISGLRTFDKATLKIKLYDFSDASIARFDI